MWPRLDRRPGATAVTGQSAIERGDEPPAVTAVRDRAREPELAEQPSGVLGKRGELVAILVVGFLAILCIVELFVRLVLDPALENPELEVAIQAAALQQPADNSQSPDAARWSFTGKSLTGGLSDSAFAEYQCVLAVVVCVVTGFGMEFFIGYEFLVGDTLISQRVEHAWFVAQFLFPILVMCAIFFASKQSALGLVFGIAGLWKFGFPETLLCILQGYRGAEHRGTLHRLVGFLNGLGTLTHHSSSVFYLCIFVSGLSPLTRTWVACAAPLLLQHLVVSLKYVSMPLYAATELVLEIFWECETFSILELMYLPHGVPLSAAVTSPMYTPLLRRVVCAMLLAHWLYWAAAILGAAADAARPRRQDGPPDLRREGSWQGKEVSEWQEELREYDGGDGAGHRMSQGSHGMSQGSHGMSRGGPQDESGQPRDESGQPRDESAVHS